MENVIAKIAKTFAVISGSIGAISVAIGVYVTTESGVISFAALIAVVISSFFIYCIGEGLQLLQDIKDETCNVKSDITNILNQVQEGPEEQEETAELPMI